MIAPESEEAQNMRMNESRRSKSAAELEISSSSSEEEKLSEIGEGIQSSLN